MSRIFLHGNYEGQAFVLRHETGDIFLQIEPNTVFGIGNFNNYFVKKIWLYRQPAIALITLSANMSAFEIRDLKRSRQKGFILKPGKGLWATSVGSANRGVWHLLKETSNPILIALWSHQLSAQLLEVVEEIDCKVFEGGNLCDHSRGGSYNYSHFTDGSIGWLRKRAYVKHARGKFCQIREALIQVMGGTYCIQSIRCKEKNRKIYPKIISIIITATADKAEVVAIINKIMKLN